MAAARNRYHMLVTHGRKTKMFVNHEKTESVLVCVTLSQPKKKHRGTSGLVTVYTTEHKVTIYFQTAANVHLAQN